MMDPACWRDGRIVGDAPAAFFPPANCRVVLGMVAQSMNDELLPQWLLSIAEDPGLGAELLDLSDRFQELYL